MLTIVINLLAGLMPYLDTLASPGVAAIITALEGLLPAIVSEVGAVGPIVQSIIAELSSNAAITPAQTAALSALDAQVDAAFEAAAIAAGSSPGA